MHIYIPKSFSLSRQGAISTFLFHVLCGTVDGLLNIDGGLMTKRNCISINTIHPHVPYTLPLRTIPKRGSRYIGLHPILGILSVTTLSAVAFFHAICIFSN